MMYIQIDNKRMAFLLLASSLSFLPICLNAQTYIPKGISSTNYSLAGKKDSRELKIGDEVPEMVFEKVLNYKEKKAKLSDFRGKLIILDMWSTICTSCIAAFPKMEKLQEKFNDQIQILLVNPHTEKYDTEDKINSILNKFKKRTGFYPSLPIPIHDSILNEYFPHKSVPHQIWIDSNSKVIGISGFNEVTEENVIAVLKGNKVDIPFKNDWAFDRKKPLLFEDNGGSAESFLYRSIFAKYNGGIGFTSGIRLNDSQEAVGVYMLNKSLRHFINTAYAEVLDCVPASMVLLDVKDSSMFQSNFSSQNTYSYDVTFAPMPRDKLKVYKLLREDLRRFFNISVRKEKRIVNCLVLLRTEKLLKVTSKHQKPEIELENNSIKKFIHNYPISQIITILQDLVKMPMFDETGFTNNIDIDFPDSFNFSDTKGILRLLKNLGIDIKGEKRELQVVVISDKTDF